MNIPWGQNLKITLFGQSHSPAIGVVVDGLPAGLPVDLAALQSFLARRAPGGQPWSTPRKETDDVEIVSGLHEGRTCGAPIAALVRNRDCRSADYALFSRQPRPGHADYPAQVRYRGFQDPRGGGAFSGRLTAPLQSRPAPVLTRRILYSKSGQAAFSGDFSGETASCAGKDAGKKLRGQL